MNLNKIISFDNNYVKKTNNCVVMWSCRTLAKI